MELRSALNEALARGETVRREGLRLRDEQEVREVAMRSCRCGRARRRRNAASCSSKKTAHPRGPPSPSGPPVGARASTGGGLRGLVRPGMWPPRRGARGSPARGRDRAAPPGAILHPRVPAIADRAAGRRQRGAALGQRGDPVLERGAAEHTTSSKSPRRRSNRPTRSCPRSTSSSNTATWGSTTPPTTYRTCSRAPRSR